MRHEQDAAIIREAQERYAKSRDNKELTTIYQAATRIAAGQIAQQSQARGFTLSMEQTIEKAHDAAAYVALRFMNINGFKLKSPAGYIYTCVKRELYRRKAIDRATVRKAREELEDGE